MSFLSRVGSSQRELPLEQPAGPLQCLAWCFNTHSCFYEATLSLFTNYCGAVNRTSPVAEPKVLPFLNILTPKLN